MGALIKVDARRLRPFLGVPEQRKLGDDLVFFKVYHAHLPTNRSIPLPEWVITFTIGWMRPALRSDFVSRPNIFSP